MIKVLIIDDEPRIKQYLERYMQMKGFDVVFAEDGKTGLSSFEERKPDIVILDMGLPDIDGKEVFKEIKTMDANIPIGVLSGYRELKEELMEMGADAYFVKPLLPPEIEEWITKTVAAQ